jgi:hypothetical protein
MVGHSYPFSLANRPPVDQADLVGPGFLPFLVVRERNFFRGRTDGLDYPWLRSCRPRRCKVNLYVKLIKSKAFYTVDTAIAERRVPETRRVYTLTSIHTHVHTQIHA